MAPLLWDWLFPVEMFLISHNLLMSNNQDSVLMVMFSDIVSSIHLYQQ